VKWSIQGPHSRNPDLREPAAGPVDPPVQANQSPEPVDLDAPRPACVLKTHPHHAAKTRPQPAALILSPPIFVTESLVFPPQPRNTIPFRFSTRALLLLYDKVSWFKVVYLLDTGPFAWSPTEVSWARR